MYASPHPATRENLLRSMNRKIVPSLLVVGAIAILCISQVYTIREDGGADLLWDKSEGYLFVYENYRGFRISYLAYPWVVFKQYLNAPPDPDDEYVSAAVFHITSAGIERYSLDLPAASLETPFEGQIYANCNGSLCKWAGAHFEPASEEERRKLDGLNRLAPNDIDDGPDGWSKRRIGLALHDYQFSVGIGKVAKLDVDVTNAERAAYSRMSVVLLRPGQSPEKVWYRDGYPRRVSKAEYDQLFHRH